MLSLHGLSFCSRQRWGHCGAGPCQTAPSASSVRFRWAVLQCLLCSVSQGLQPRTCVFPAQHRVPKVVQHAAQVPVGSWFDDMSDTELRDLMPFFDKLSRVEDVYTVLRNSNNASSGGGGGGGGSPAFPAPLLMNGAALHS